MIGNLRNMAQDMGTEVENQNRQLDRINLKVSIANSVCVCGNALRWDISVCV
jgi:hypothetical protein